MLKTTVYGTEPFNLFSYPPIESKIRVSGVTLRDFAGIPYKEKGFSEGA